MAPSQGVTRREMSGVCAGVAVWVLEGVRDGVALREGVALGVAVWVRVPLAVAVGVCAEVAVAV